MIKDWRSISNEHSFNWRLGKPFFILNGIRSRNTHHKFETFDGTKLNFTNWRYHEPKLWDGVTFGYHNDETMFYGKFLKQKVLFPTLSNGF